jgi:amino acid adenylation domain-containing protein/thioester reductase-like protein
MKPPIEWNNTYTSYPDNVCIQQLFEQQVERTPEAIAIVFEDKQLTYQQLNDQANQLAHYLKKLGVRREILVGICIERSIEMIVGLLGILKAGGAYLPLDPTYPKERLAFMLKDSQISVIVTQEQLSTNLPQNNAKIVSIDKDWHNISQETTENPINQTKPDNLAYCIYTSGSTGQPKGVLLEHRGLCNLATATIKILNIKADNRVLQFASINFDASIWEIVMALIAGASLYLGTRNTLLPGSPLIKFLRTQEITTVLLPPSVLATLPVENFTNLQTIIVGGESCSSELIARWAPGRNFYNAYGPTEATVCATIEKCSNNNQAPPIGTPIANTQIYILDKQMQQVEIGVEGELCIGGVGLARAYLNRPELTNEKFINTSNGRLYKTGDLARYRSDGKLEFLGRIDHQVKIHGFRIELEEIETQLHKHPGIENTVVVAQKDKLNDKQLVAYIVYQAALERVPLHSACIVELDNQHQVELVTEEISPTGVDLLGMPDDCKLNQQVRLQLWLPETDNDLWLDGRIAWIYKQRAGIEFDLTPNKQEQIRNSIKYIQEKKGLVNTLQNILVEHLRDFLQKSLPNYMIPSHFVILDSLPLTANGKIDRQALPAPESFQTYSLTQEKLIKIWSEFLPQKVMGIHDDFLALGGSSLLSASIISRINHELQINLAPYSLFETSTIAELSKQIETKTKQYSQNPIKPASRDDNIPLSFAQQQLWLVQQLIPESMPVYNEPTTIVLGGPINAAILEQSIKEIIQRHEAFRTTFKTVEGKPVQIIYPSISFSLPLIDLTHLPANERETESLKIATKDAIKPFDLQTGPLFRATLIKLEDQDYRLFLTWHHIILDGISIYNIFLPELESLYKAFSKDTISQLETPDIQYADYAIWQRQQLSNLDNQLKYWKQQLADLPQLQLPTDRSRSAQQTYNGARECLALSKQLTESLKELSQKEGVTLFMTLFAAFNVLLYRYTGQEDIAVGTVTAGRNKPELESVFGFFLNTLVLRTDLSKQPNFQQLLKRVREVTLQAYAHEELPFEKLVEELQPDRNLGTNPLFQVSFIMEPTMLNLESGWTISQLDIHTATSKFDLTVELDERAEGIIGRIEYNTDLFDQSRIIRMIGHYQTLLESIITNSQQPISHLTILTEQEQQQFREWNSTSQVLPEKQCIHQLFEQQVECTPEAIALVFENQQLTYQQLNQRANQLAHYLRKLGVKPETLVGICVERSLEMIIGILGIIKAGGAYVPLDPTYPEERLNFMLEDAKVEILLTQQHLQNKLLTQSQINLDSDWEKIAQESTDNPVNTTTADNLVYIIYTSGSTGKPKGVMLEHRGLCNLAKAQIYSFDIHSQSRILQFASFGFDASISEIFITLISGSILYLAKRKALLPGPSLINIINDNNINTITFPPSVLATLPINQLTTLRTIIIAGETCSAKLVADLILKYKVFNAYGPTETTICATIAKCTDGSHKPPIGFPIANIQIYVLDHNLQQVPIGVPGELYIGGIGLARGYINNPKLTTEKFIPNPFTKKHNDRLYKTGDFVLYLSDGQLEFLERIDNQVKIRGFRIELGEIEAVMNQHSAIKEALVTTYEYIGDKRLIAYFTANKQNIPSTEELRSFIIKKLPNYMVPSTFILLDTLPLTANGKIDYNKLPAPEGTRPKLKDKLVAPCNPIEAHLARIWAKFLKVDQVGIYDNFFDLGGNSLIGVQVLNELKNTLFVEIPLTCIFEYPTIAELSITVDAVQKNGNSVLKKVIDFNAEAVLDKNIYPRTKLLKTSITEPHYIFITGATGFLGAYLIDELLHKTYAKIYCLVRASNEGDGIKKLRKNLEQYALWNPNFDTRIIAICGDLEQPFLGLSVPQFENLADQIDMIYHSGAEVNFAKPYSIVKPANVLGTQEVLRLACFKKLKPVHYISTLAVMSIIGNSNRPKVITEYDDINNLKDFIFADIGYVQSKWVAEKLVWTAKSRGIPVTIFRTGNIMGHSKTGYAYTKQYIFRLIKWCLQSKTFPNLINKKDELIPVDYASQAIVHLSLQQESLGKAFHIVPLSSKSISLIKFFELMASYGYKLKKLPYKQWIDNIIQNSIKNHNNPIFPLLHLLPERVGNITRMEWYQNTPDFDCQNTLNGLANTSINCPPMNAQLIDIYLSYLIEIGFIEPPPSKNNNAILTNNVVQPKVSHLEY